MVKFRINGRQPLSGTINVNGSKNAAMPILVAALLSPHPIVIRNVPRIEDVFRTLEIIQSVGGQFAWTAEHEVSIEARHVDPTQIDAETVRKLRASVLMIGALVGRCQFVRVPDPGGDQIGARPLEPHLEAFAALGATIEQADGQYALSLTMQSDAACTLSEFSVTATENVILATVLATDRTTTINCAAADPSVQDLCWFLQSLGAQISGIGTHTLVIKGVHSLRQQQPYTVCPDPIEAGTFICLSAASKSKLTIRNVPVTLLPSELQKFREANVVLDMTHTRPDPLGHYTCADVTINPSSRLRSIRNLHNMPFPGFVADLLQPFAVMLTQAAGTSLVHDWMYEGRLKYAEELMKMGADVFIADPHRILVTGPTELHAADITSYDIRTGASLIIASMIADGTSTLGPIYQVDRGYEQLDERLRELGASIQRFES